MSEETISMKFTKRTSPFQWECEASELPGLVGIGGSLQDAFRSWIESLPTVMVSQRVQLEAVQAELERARKR